MLRFITKMEDGLGKRYEVKEILNKVHSLFGDNTPLKGYFIYNANDFKDKKDVDYFVSHLDDNDDIVCVVENIDKRSAFYKKYKDRIPITEKIDYVALFIKDKYSIKDIDEKDFISFLYSLYYRRIYKEEAGMIINSVLTGRVTVKIAKKLFMVAIF